MKQLPYYEIIKSTMEFSPATRDCDWTLFVRTLDYINANRKDTAPDAVELPPVESQSLKFVIEQINAGVYPSFESVSRLRRLVQSKHIELRGKTWDSRHKRADEVLEQIRRAD